MMNALYSGVTGMQTHQVKLDVIGNNVANVNTVGYKSSNVTFSDAISQSMSGASGPSSSGRGGTNPQQIGIGVNVANINRVNTVGSLQLTGSATDLAIDGDGYFIVKSGDSEEYFFTRAGNFGVDVNGNLVSSDGYYVCGFTGGSYDNDGVYSFDTTANAEPINIFQTGDGSSSTMAPDATEKIVLSGSLDSSLSAKGVAADDIDTPPTEPDFSTSVYAYDNLGELHDIDIDLSKCFVDETDPDNPFTTYYYELDTGDGSTVTGYLKFDGEGNIVEDDVDFPVNLTVSLDSGGGTTPSEFDLDLSNLTMNGNESNVYMSYMDGYASGEFTDFTIGGDGTIVATYSNGQSQPIAMIGLAQFSNPAGLESIGNSLLRETPNSGTFTTAYAPGANGTGSLVAGYLEMSNVDLSREMTELITTQRGYQACSRIITTADEMLQELLNLKR